MKLTESQKARLQALIYEPFVEELPEARWDFRRQELRSEVSDALELHAFVLNFNWDSGTEALEWVLDHQECDVATACLIFALGEPGCFYWKVEKGEKLNEQESRHWGFLKAVEQRVGAGHFKQGQVAFDPRNQDGIDYFRVNPANPGNRLVPEFMKRPRAGEKIENPIV